MPSPRRSGPRAAPAWRPAGEEARGVVDLAAMGPRRHRRGDTVGRASLEALGAAPQWGHDVTAVETLSPQELCQRREGRNGATASPPWRRLDQHQLVVVDVAAMGGPRYTFFSCRQWAPGASPVGASGGPPPSNLAGGPRKGAPGAPPGGPGPTGGAAAANTVPQWGPGVTAVETCRCCSMLSGSPW